MKPGAHNKNIEGARILGFDMPVCLLRAVIVLVVIPAADRHGRTFDAIEMRQDVAVLPILVVGRVRHHVVPVRLADADATLVTVGHLFQSAGVKEVIIAVLGVSAFPRLDIIPVAGWPGHRLKAGVKPVILGEKQGAVVVHVIAVKPIADGCLRRASL